jgi:hypothetical protein
MQESKSLKNDVGAIVVKAYHDSITELDHSIIWKTVVTKLNQVAKSHYDKNMPYLFRPFRKWYS